MKKLLILLVGFILTATLIIPVMAEQNSGGIITGDENTQENSNYNYQYSQAAGGTITGNDNNLLNTNINGDINLIDKNTMSTSSSQLITNNFLPSTTSIHYTLDTGPITSQVISIYDGEVITINNDEGREVLQRSGNQFRYTVKSSIPVLAYIINTNDANAVQAQSSAPVYDTIFKRFDQGNLAVEYRQKHLSTFQQFTFTVKKDGRYSLVIDTRTSQRLNGMQSVISGNTIDLYYLIEKVTGGSYTPIQDSKYIGTTDTYSLRPDGSAITS